MTEEALLKEIAAGNEEAFRQFYLCTVRPVHSYILSLTRNSHEAEDVLQETYLKIWTDATEYRPQGKPLAWVFTIARNLCYMRFREQRRWAEFGLSELEDCEEGKNCEQIDQAADRGLRRPIRRSGTGRRGAGFGAGPGSGKRWQKN